MNSSIAYIYPAFVTDFIGCETEELHSMGIEINDYLEKAASVCGEEIRNFSQENRDYFEDELMTQYITYIYSCAVSDLLAVKRIPVHCIAAYSMGIYAALYRVGSITFSDGLLCVREAFQAIQKNIPVGKYTMGLTGGLELDDVSKILADCAPRTYIVNSNNRHTFVFSGPEQEVRALISKAREEGALMTRLMPVSIPYHSPYLQDAGSDFASFLSTLPLRDSAIPFISSLTKERITSAKKLKTEMVNNLYHPFKWHETFQLMLSKGIHTFFECGAGDGLTKICKFIEGDYQCMNLKNLRKYLTTR